MLSYAIKKDGKTVKKGWIKNAEISAFLEAVNGTEIVFKTASVDVLPTQAELEARGKKD